MKKIYTDIEIEAPAEWVWQIVTDFGHYEEWNPFIKRADGELKVGGNVTGYVTAPDVKPMSLKVVLKKVDPNHELRWRGGPPVPGLFNGDHAYVIEPLGPGRVRFIHEEAFTGVLVPLLWRLIFDKKVRRGFVQMNEALKKRAEKAPA